MWHFRGSKTYSDPSYIFSGSRPQPLQYLRPWPGPKFTYTTARRPSCVLLNCVAVILTYSDQIRLNGLNRPAGCTWRADDIAPWRHGCWFRRPSRCHECSRSPSARTWDRPSCSAGRRGPRLYSEKTHHFRISGEETWNFRGRLFTYNCNNAWRKVVRINT